MERYSKSFKEKVLENQRSLRKIYATELEKIGGVDIWERISDNGKKKHGGQDDKM